MVLGSAESDQVFFHDVKEDLTLENDHALGDPVWRA
jgi:hypothetical protein